MPFETGHKKIGGRQEGTPNRITKEVREELKAIVFSELNQLPKHLALLEPEKRVELLLKLLPYVFPKVRDVHYQEGDPLSFGR